jgi:hypothetical protein
VKVSVSAKKAAHLLSDRCTNGTVTPLTVIGPGSVSVFLILAPSTSTCTICAPKNLPAFDAETYMDICCASVSLSERNGSVNTSTESIKPEAANLDGTNLIVLELYLNEKI